MKNNKKLAIATLLAVGAAVPGLAAADHRDRSRRGAGWQNLGEVGTHVHDSEDYLAVRGQRLDALQLRARDSAVAIDGVQIQFADGRNEFVAVHQWVRPGQPVMINVPESSSPVKMLVLDYGNSGPYWRARETAHLQVLGVAENGRYNRDWRDGEQRRMRVPYDREGATYQTTAPAYQPPPPPPRRVYQTPAPASAGARFEIRGGVRVRIN